MTPEQETEEFRVADLLEIQEIHDEIYHLETRHAVRVLEGHRIAHLLGSFINLLKREVKLLEDKYDKAYQRKGTIKLFE